MATGKSSNSNIHAESGEHVSSQTDAVRSKYLKAQELHRQGHLRQAEALFRELTLQAPGFFDAWHQLGILQAQKGNFPSAIEFIDHALALNPNSAVAHSTLGNVLLAMRRPAGALVEFERALTLKPDLAEAHYNLGNALYQLNRPGDALISLNRALEHNPSSAGAHYSHGNLLLSLKQPGEAVHSFDRALKLNPEFAEALNNRGIAQLELQFLEDALASIERALSLKPDYVEALNNRGTVLQQLGRFKDALASFDRALEINPNMAETHNNRGNILIALHRHEEAQKSFDLALHLRPDYAEGLFNRASLFSKLRRFEDAMADFDRAIVLRPGYVEALVNRGNVLAALKQDIAALASFDSALQLRPDCADALQNRASVLKKLRRYKQAANAYARLLAVNPESDFALGNMFNCQLHTCDWSRYTETAEQIGRLVMDGKTVDTPFSFLAFSISSAVQLRCAEIFSANQVAASPTRLWKGQRYAHDKIRLAYLSADFHNHATAYLIAGLFEAHDAQRFELTGISYGPDSTDGMRARIQDSFIRFIDARQMTDFEVARRIQELEIDIAIDLKGYTMDGREGILAHRPAPIQINYLGYPGTMGADYIDYIIADAQLISEKDESFYTEKIVYMPDSYQVNDSKRSAAVCTYTRADASLPENGIVFCCFNNNYKITPNVFDIWMRLLKEVSGSVLWLYCGNSDAPHNLRREAEARGVTAERLIFAEKMSIDQHLARHRLADLFLDTLPYNAHTTASDALWAGLPVVTCVGETFASRVAASLLYAIGMPELICSNLEEYERLALEFATNGMKLSSVRDKLADHRLTYPLFDTGRFCQHLESAYVEMWERHQSGEPPKTFRVHPVN